MQTYPGDDTRDVAQLRDHSGQLVVEARLPVWRNVCRVNVWRCAGVWTRRGRNVDVARWQRRHVLDDHEAELIGSLVVQRWLNLDLSLISMPTSHCMDDINVHAF